jgi:hypothetical protein
MIKTITLLVSVGLIFFLIYSHKQQVLTLKSANSNIDSLYCVIDSISNEEFISRMNYERYEIALDKLKEEDSISADKFENCLKNTE